MKRLVIISIGLAILLTRPPLAFAAANTEVVKFTDQTLAVLTVFASLVSVFFIVYGGTQYITSTGKPNAIVHAKNTIIRALIGLLIVLGANVFSSILHTAFITSTTGNTTQILTIKPIQPPTVPTGLTQVLIDAITGFLQAIIQSATKPIVDGIINFLTTTPSLLTNSVVFNFWLVMVGIVDSLFALIIALIGFQFMSASTFGFDEIEFKHLLPRIGLAFLLANTSLFLIDGISSFCNLLTNTIIQETGGFTHAWVLNAFDPSLLSTGGSGLAGSVIITIIFMLLFIILAVVLLLFYLGRLITISVGAVLSPFVFLLWVLPGWSDFAMIAIRSYVITLITVFIHVVIIQLASSFLTLPGQSGQNSILSILIGIATLFTLLKAPTTISQFGFYTASSGALKKFSGQFMNAVHTSKKVESDAPVHGSFPERRNA